MADIHLKVTIGNVKPDHVEMTRTAAIEAITRMVDTCNIWLEADDRIDTAIVTGPAANESDLIATLRDISNMVQDGRESFGPNQAFTDIRIAAMRAIAHHAKA